MKSTKLKLVSLGSIFIVAAIPLVASCAPKDENVTPPGKGTGDSNLKKTNQKFKDFVKVYEKENTKLLESNVENIEGNSAFTIPDKFFNISLGTPLETSSKSVLDYYLNGGSFSVSGKDNTLTTAHKAAGGSNTYLIRGGSSFKSLLEKAKNDRTFAPKWGHALLDAWPSETDSTKAILQVWVFVSDGDPGSFQIVVPWDSEGSPSFQKSSNQKLIESLSFKPKVSTKLTSDQISKIKSNTATPSDLSNLEFDLLKDSVAYSATDKSLKYVVKSTKYNATTKKVEVKIEAEVGTKLIDKYRTSTNNYISFEVELKDFQVQASTPEPTPAPAPTPEPTPTPTPTPEPTPAPAPVVPEVVPTNTPSISTDTKFKDFVKVYEKHSIKLLETNVENYEGNSAFIIPDSLFNITVGDPSSASSKSVLDYYLNGGSFTANGGTNALTTAHRAAGGSASNFVRGGTSFKSLLAKAKNDRSFVPRWGHPLLDAWPSETDSTKAVLQLWVFNSSASPGSYQVVIPWTGSGSQSFEKSFNQKLIESLSFNSINLIIS